MTHARITVRTSPELHADIIRLAALRRTSVNDVIVSILSREVTSTLSFPYWRWPVHDVTAQRPAAKVTSERKRRDHGVTAHANGVTIP